MCFGQNKAGVEVCEHCQKPFAECGWSVWLHYSEIKDIAWREAMATRYQPKMVAVLKTKWPACEVKVPSMKEDDHFPAV